MSEQPEPCDPKAPVSIYQQLSSASPDQRRLLVLSLLAQHPDNILELPRKDGVGANLNGIDLSQYGRSHSDKTGEQRNSSSAPYPAVNLARSLLPGASLERANLSGLDLLQANLSGAVLRKANLCHSNLEHSNLEHADLAGAQLQLASLGKCNLQGAKLEDTDLRGAKMRFSQLQNAVLEGGNLQGADLWGSDMRNAILKGANVRDVILNESDLSEADGSDATFANTSFVGANLSQVDFSNSDLRGADLRHANLQRAILSGAQLQGVDLSSCNISNACFAGTLLNLTQMSIAQLAGAPGEELIGDYDAARKSYLALERNFKSLSDSEGASWAYVKRRRMQKKLAFHNALSAIKSRQTVRGFRFIAAYISDQIVEYTCNYGESIARVMAALLVVYIFFIGLYGITGSVTRTVETPDGAVHVVTRELVDLAIFSLLAMTTSGSPSIGLRPSHEVVHLLTGIQALFGIALTGLLGFVLGNRIRR